VKAAKSSIKFEQHCVQKHPKTPIKKIDIAKAMRNAARKKK
jgi:hypothetical protein